MLTERTALLRYDPWVYTPLPRSVSECLETSTATPVERTAILLACCSEQKMSADLILPARWETLSEDVPVLEAMGDPLVRVRTDYEHILWIDPVTGNVAPQHSLAPGVTYFIVGPDEVETVVAGRVDNSVRMSAFWDLEKGEGSAEVEIAGPVALTLDWKDPGNLARSWAEGWCDSAEVTDLEILRSAPDGIHFIVSLDAPLPEADDHGRTSVDLPLPPLEIIDLLPGGLDLARSETDGVLFFPAGVHAEAIWKLKPPEGLSLLPGPSVEMEWEDGRVVVRREDRPPFVAVVFDINLGGRPIIPAEYGGYRSLFIEATDPGLMRLVFADGAEE
jgi:hypothetical protein